MARPQGDVTITIDKELKKRIDDKLKAVHGEGSNLPHYRSVKAFVALAVDVALKEDERALLQDSLDTAISNATLMYETACNRARDAERLTGNDGNDGDAGDAYPSFSQLPAVLPVDKRGQGA